MGLLVFHMYLKVLCDDYPFEFLGNAVLNIHVRSFTPWFDFVRWFARDARANLQKFCD